MSHDNRRAFLGKVAAATVTGLLTRPGVATAAGPALESNDERYLWRMLEGVRLGEPFYEDWYIIDAYPPVAGGVTLTVARGPRGEPLRVDVVRRDGEPRAPAYTRFLELYTMDAGGGTKHMDPELVRALQALADRLQDNEAQWMLADSLMSHQDRLERYPAFMKRASKELTPVLP